MDPEEVLDDLLGELKLRNYSVTRVNNIDSIYQRESTPPGSLSSVFTRLSNSVTWKAAAESLLRIFFPAFSCLRVFWYSVKQVLPNQSWLSQTDCVCRTI